MDSIRGIINKSQISDISLPRPFQEFLSFYVPVFVVAFQIILYSFFVNKSSPVQSTLFQNIQFRRFAALCHVLQIRLSFHWPSCLGSRRLRRGSGGTRRMYGRQISLGFCRVFGDCLFFSTRLAFSSMERYVTVWPANSYDLVIIIEPSSRAVSVFGGSSALGLALILLQRASKSSCLSCAAGAALKFALSS